MSDPKVRVTATPEHIRVTATSDKPFAYYTQKKTDHEIVSDEELKTRLQDASPAFRELIESSVLCPPKVDPQPRCFHSFRWDLRRGPRGMFICKSCNLALHVSSFDAAGYDMKYDSERTKLADTAGQLQTMNNELLIENAKLRRKIEQLEKKK